MHATTPQPINLVANPELLPDHLDHLLDQRRDLDSQLYRWSIPFETFESRVVTLLHREIASEDMLGRPRQPEAIARRRRFAWLVVPERAVYELVMEAHTAEHRRLAPEREKAEAERSAQAMAAMHERIAAHKAAAAAAVSAASAVEVQRRATSGAGASEGNEGQPKKRRTRAATLDRAVWRAAEATGKAQRHARITELRAKGLSHSAIAERAGCSVSYVYTVVGSGKPPKVGLDATTRERMGAMRTQGVPVVQIAASDARDRRST